MPETDEQLIEKLASHEADLVEIYAEVYPALKAADRTHLPAEVVADIENLDPPHSIEPAKAAAILKSIKGSTPEDRFQFEFCYGVSMPDGSANLGGFVGEKLKEIGLSYHDFWPYLGARGWLRDSGEE